MKSQHILEDRVMKSWGKIENPRTALEVWGVTRVSKTDKFWLKIRIFNLKIWVFVENLSFLENSKIWLE